MKNIFKTVRAPMVHLTMSTSKRMWILASCMFFIVFQSGFSDGFRSVYIALAAVLAALAAELVLDLSAGRSTVKDGSAAVTGISIALVLPNTIPLLIPIVSAVFAIVFIKRCFGGNSGNWLQPSAAAYLFAHLSWPDIMEKSLQNSRLEILSSAIENGIHDLNANPIAILKMASVKASTSDELLTSSLNKLLFNRMGSEMPSGYIDLFVNRLDGLIADRALLFTLFTIILLAAFRIGRPLMSISFLLAYSFIVRIFGALPLTGIIGSGDMLFYLSSGGTVFVAFFLLPDGSTSPRSMNTSLIYSLVCGIGAALLRIFAEEPQGAIIFLLFMNMFVPAVRLAETYFQYRFCALPMKKVKKGAARD